MPNLQTESRNPVESGLAANLPGRFFALEEKVKFVRKLREKLTDEVRRERKEQGARKAAEGDDKLDAMVRRSIEIHGP